MIYQKAGIADYENNNLIKIREIIAKILNQPLKYKFLNY